jgi:hypothetical protein
MDRATTPNPLPNYFDILFSATKFSNHQQTPNKIFRYRNNEQDSELRKNKGHLMRKRSFWGFFISDEDLINICSFFKFPSLGTFGI